MMTYHELRTVQSKEREEKDLQDLGKGFIDDVAAYFAAKQKALDDARKKDSIFSDDARNELEAEINNALFILGDIYDRRLRKILNQAMIAIKTKDIGDTTRMLEHEMEMYDKVTELLNLFRKTFFDIIIGEKVKNAQKDIVQKPMAATDEDRYAATCNVPAFAWHDGKSYGPFTCGEVVALPDDVAGFLANKGKVKRYEAAKED